MARLFQPGADTLARLVLVGLVLGPFLLFGLAYFVEVSPYVRGTNATVDQSVPFSHKHHVAEVGLSCRFCHATVETNRFAGLPTTHVCMTCHSQLFTTTGMLAPVRESLAKGEPLRWTRVNNLPGYVYFDHSMHVTHGVGCANCHGAVADMPLTRQVAPLTMRWCLDCHRDPGPHLSPPGKVFDTHYLPRNPPDEARRLMQVWHVRAASLTNCSTCHR
jgi:hypothetical protein